MHDAWQEALGSARPLDLTPARRQKYRALYSEQLAHSPDPGLAFRAILLAVRASDWHMSNRSYQLPESLFRSPERRSQWVEKALEMAKPPVSQQEQNVIKIREYLRRNEA
jgi:hypothetical protein